MTKKNFNLYKNWLIILTAFGVAINVSALVIKSNNSTKETNTHKFIEDASNHAPSLQKEKTIKIIAGVGHIKLQNLMANYSVSVYDLQGRSVAQRQALNSELIMNLTSGAYLVKVNDQHTARTMVY